MSTELSIRELSLLIALFLVIIVWFIMMLKPHPMALRKHKKLYLAIYFPHNQNQFTMNTTNLSITQLKAYVGILFVTLGKDGPTIPGTLSNITEVSSDPTQDTAATDPNNPNAVDVTPATNQGNSLVTVTADFDSTETIPSDDGTSQVPKYSVKGLTYTVAVTNNIQPPAPVLNADFSGN